MASQRTFYRSEEFSDIQVQLVAADDRHRTIKRRRTESAADASDARLAVVVIDVFPAHKVELSKASDVLEMMVNRLDGGRPLQLAIEPVQLDAARCMFALIYQVPDTHDHSMGRLNQAGLLHLALLAEEFGLPDITSSAVESLENCKFDADLIAAFWSLPAWPDVLLPLMPSLVKRKMNSQDGDPQEAVQRLVVHVLGDLEEVWTAADDAKRRLLLHLPMAALKLLLESKQLKVAAEDTVLFTVCAFVGLRPGWTRCHAPVIQDFKFPNVDWESRQKYKQAEAAVDWFEARMVLYKSADEQLELTQRQLAEVLGLVCLQRLSKLALSSVILQLPWLALLSWQSRRGIFPWLHHPLVDGLLKVNITRLPSLVKSWTFQVSASVADLKAASRQRRTRLPWFDKSADMAAFAGMGWSAGFWPYLDTCSGGGAVGQGDKEGDEEQQQQQQQEEEQPGGTGTGGLGLVVGIGGWNNFFNLSIERWKQEWCDDDWNSKAMPDDLGKVAALVTITVAQ
eukprot:gene4596-4850_t